jgi:hypothetical protein
LNSTNGRNRKKQPHPLGEDVGVERMKSRLESGLSATYGGRERCSKKTPCPAVTLSVGIGRKTADKARGSWQTGFRRGYGQKTSRFYLSEARQVWGLGSQFYPAGLRVRARAPRQICVGCRHVTSTRATFRRVFSARSHRPGPRGFGRRCRRAIRRNPRAGRRDRWARTESRHEYVRSHRPCRGRGDSRGVRRAATVSSFRRHALHELRAVPDVPGRSLLGACRAHRLCLHARRRRGDRIRRRRALSRDSRWGWESGACRWWRCCARKASRFFASGSTIRSAYRTECRRWMGGVKAGCVSHPRNIAHTEQSFSNSKSESRISKQGGKFECCKWPNFPAPPRFLGSRFSFAVGPILRSWLRLDWL